MKQIGACRTCLVEVEGANGYPASCSVPVSDGMKVWTDTPEVAEVRRGVLELTMAMVSSNGNGAGDYGDLTVASAKYGIDQSRWATRSREPVDDSNPVFDIAMSDCILCGRCVQACQDGHQFIGAIDFLGAGGGSRIGTFMDKPLASSVCTTCGQCLSVCPTGAIDVKKPPKTVASVRRDDLPILRRRLRRGGPGRRAGAHDRDAGQPRQPVEPGHALRQGPVRVLLRTARGPDHDADGPAKRQALARLLGRGAWTTWPSASRATGPPSSGRSAPPRRPTRTATCSRSGRGWSWAPTTSTTARGCATRRPCRRCWSRSGAAPRATRTWTTRRPGASSSSARTPTRTTPWPPRGCGGRSSSAAPSS